MKIGNGVMVSVQIRDISKMKFIANYENIYTDESIKAIQKAKDFIRKKQKLINEKMKSNDV